MAHTIKKMTVLLSLPLMAWLGLTACNKAGDSQVNDVANFSRDANQALALNHCGPDKPNAFVESALSQLPKGSQPIVASAASANLIKSVLSAAPRGLVVYYLAAGGRIETRPKLTADDCQMNDVEANFAKEGTASLKSCWQKADGKPAVILVEDSEAAIRHSLIRSLALVYADIFVQQMAQSSKASDRANATKFKGQMDVLANAYLALMNGKSKSVHDGMVKIQNADGDLFSRMVWAEMTDSVYCRRSTFDSVWSHSVSGQSNGKTVQVGNPFRPMADTLKNEDLLFFYPASLDGVKGSAGQKNKLDCPWFFSDEKSCKSAFAS